MQSAWSGPALGPLAFGTPVKRCVLKKKNPLLDQRSQQDLLVPPRSPLAPEATPAALLATRALPLEHVVARVCREAGARVVRNIRLADMNVDVPVADARRIEVVSRTASPSGMGPDLPSTPQSCRP